MFKIIIGICTKSKTTSFIVGKEYIFTENGVMGEGGRWYHSHLGLFPDAKDYIEAMNEHWNIFGETFKFEEKKSEPTKKSLLKDSMKVMLANGCEGVIIGSFVHFTQIGEVNGISYTSEQMTCLNNYGDNLKNAYDRKLNIIKITEEIVHYDKQAEDKAKKEAKRKVKLEKLTREIEKAQVRMDESVEEFNRLNREWKEL